MYVCERKQGGTKGWRCETMRMGDEQKRSKDDETEEKARARERAYRLEHVARGNRTLLTLHICAEPPFVRGVVEDVVRLAKQKTTSKIKSACGFFSCRIYRARVNSPPQP